jgi:hypothetical protein
MRPGDTKWAHLYRIPVVKFVLKATWLLTRMGHRVAFSTIYGKTRDILGPFLLHPRTDTSIAT